MNELLTVTGEEEIKRTTEFESKGPFVQPNYLQIPVLFVTDRAKSPNGAFTDVPRQSGLEFREIVLPLRLRTVSGLTT